MGLYPRQTRPLRPPAKNTVNRLASSTDRQLTAERFVAALNTAKAALAAGQNAEAQVQIETAREQAQHLKSLSSGKAPDRIAGGKLTYKGEDTALPRYVPVETGPLKMKNIKPRTFLGG